MRKQTLSEQLERTRHDRAQLARMAERMIKRELHEHMTDWRYSMPVETESGEDWLETLRRLPDTAALAA